MFELIFGNEDYVKITHNTSIMTTKWNLLELHYHLLVHKGKDEADEAYNAFKGYIIEADHDDMKAASLFRSQHTRKKLSFIDCAGYAIAKRRGAFFLTGDAAFQGMENVEFVK